jgi:hypothetical protein
MNVVAHMPVRNEFDIVEETVREALRWVDTLVVLDGESDDGTRSLLHDLAAELKAAGKTLDLHVEADLGAMFTNYNRQRLLELTAPHRPDWVLSVDGDEIWHCDPKRNCPSPIEAIEAAERAGANVVRAWVPQFWLTFEDLRRGALIEDETVSVQERRRWYSWGHAGTFIWRWDDRHYYPDRPSKRTPELPGLTWRQWQVAGPLTPICKHYCFRGVAQGLERLHLRQVRGGRKDFGKYFLPNWIIDERLVGLHYLGADGAWCPEENHEPLYTYMAGKLQEGTA